MEIERWIVIESIILVDFLSKMRKMISFLFFEDSKLF